MAILPIVVGAILMIGALAYAGYWLSVVLRWPSAKATVLRYWKTKGDEGVHYAPVYRFQTRDGKTYTAISNWGSWHRPWPRGAIVTVRYCPESPQRTEIQASGNSLGIIFTLVALALMFWAVAYWNTFP